MAQYFTDFSDANIADDTVPDWSAHWDEPDQWRVVADGAGKAVQIDPINNIFGVLLYDGFGDTADQEIYAETKTSYGPGFQQGVVVRANEDPDRKGYIVGALANSKLLLSRLIGSSETVLSLSDTLSSYTSTEKFKLRVRVSGTSIKTRVWRSTDAEPVSWTQEVTDTGISSGRVGLFARNKLGVKTWYNVGIGTNGDAAPTAPVTGPNTPINPSITSLLATSARLNWEQG